MSDNEVRQRVRLEFIEFINRFCKESFLLALLGGCFYLLLALVTFDSRDPGWSHLGYSGKVTNAGGVAGAWVADLSLSFVGYLAYLVPVLIAVRALLFLRRRDEGLLDRLPFFVLRAAGGILSVVAGSALASLHFSSQWLALPFSAGGLLGLAIADELLPWFDLLGSSLLLGCGFLIGFSLLTNLSWVALAEGLGRLVFDLGLWFKSLLAERPARPAVGVDEAAEAVAEAVAEEVAQERIKERIEETRGSDRLSAPPQRLSTGLGQVEIGGYASQSDSAGNGADGSATTQEEMTSRGGDDSSAHREMTEGDQQLAAADSPIAKSQGLFARTESLSSKVAAKVNALGFEPTPKSPPAERLEPSLESLFAEEPRSAPDDTDADLRGLDPEPLSARDRGEARDDPPWQMEPDLAPKQAAAQEQSVDRPEAPAPETPSPAPATSARHLKIVPLSEAHRPVVDEEPGESESSPASISQVDSSLSAVPGIEVLDPPEPKSEDGFNAETLEQMSRLLEAKLKDFGVVAEVVEVNPGPVITRFEIQPAPGVKVSKITNLAKDLARSMAVRSVRVVEVIAGKSTVGIEIPNQKREVVRLSEVLGSPAYRKAEARLSLGLGNDIAGNPVVVNLAKMPHLLVAGTTGSGKSVGVNAMILSLLFKATPEDVRMIMVDPKMLELSIYDGIPHLLTPVITDMKEAASGLRWCVGEMERRYRLMATMGVRNLAGFNAKVREAAANGRPLKDPLWKPESQGLDPTAPAPDIEPLPYIVVVIDEFADMMMIVGKKVEELIARIAQKARAAGIHLVLATQRPSVDVITGLIKANIPTRIAFQVSSKIDSRTILDQGGAEHLLGNGDMLYQPAGTNMPIRVHGAFVADDEVHRVVDEWKRRGTPQFIEEIFADGGDGETGSGGGALFEDEQDALYDEAVDFVLRSRRASISAVQRKLKIGYNRAARLVETMEAAGVVSEAAHNGTREVLVPAPVD